MIRSLFSAVSALKNHQVQMDVIGNNIANVNTVAFKSSRCLFEDVFSQTLKSAIGPREGRGGVNPQQVGLGMDISSIDNIFSQGNLMSTQKKTDLAIQGNGFFILSDGNNRYYTRAGNFDFDTNGNFVNPAGYMVQGYMAEDGVLGETLGDINIDFHQRLEAKATTQTDFIGNLNSDVESTSASSTTLLSKLFDNDGNPMNLHIGDVIDISGKVITPAAGDTKLTDLIDSTGTSLGISAGDTISYSGTVGGVDLSTLANYSVTAASTLEDLRADLESKVQTATGDPNITVAITSAGKLKVTAGTDSITGLKLTDDTISTDIFTFDTISAGSSGESNELSGEASNDISNTYTITPTSSLSDLAYEVQNAIRDASGGSEAVTMLNDGSLQISTDTKDITGLKMTCTGKTKFNDYGDIGDVATGETGSTTEGSRSADYTTFVTTYDSLGKAQIVTLLFTKDTSGLSNTWHWQAIVPYQDKSSVSGDTGTLTFNSDGSISGGNTAQIIFDPDGSGGANEMKVNFGFGTSDKFDGITQFASSSTVTLKEQNGYTSGTLNDISTDDNGVITGIFTNGINRTLAQIITSDFSNPGGLGKIGNNLYQQTLNSGLPQDGEPGTGTRGIIVPSTLEMSNVDLAQSFTDIIIAQRGFQVNARVITTSDQILQELVNLKR